MTQLNTPYFLVDEAAFAAKPGNSPAGAAGAQAARFCWHRRPSPCSPAIPSCSSIWPAPPPAACMRPGWARRNSPGRPTCSPPPTGRRSSRRCWATPTTLCSTPPASCSKYALRAKAAGKQVGLRVNPGVLHPGGPRHLRPLRPRLPAGHHPGQFRREHAAPAGRPALPHAVRAELRRLGDYRCTPLRRNSASICPGLQWLNLGGGHHITRPDYDIARG